MALNPIQSYIERSFYEALRVKAVAEGLTVDITDYIQVPIPDEDGHPIDSPDWVPTYEDRYTEYIAAMTALVSSNGWAVEIFGFNNTDDLGIAKIARIVLDPDSYIQGSWGLEPTSMIEPNDNPDAPNTFLRVKYPSISHEFFLNCTIIADSTSQARTLIALVHEALPVRGPLKYYFSDDTFFTESVDFLNLSSAKDGVTELRYRFRVPDILWTSAIVEEATLAQMEDAKIDIKIRERLGISIQRVLT